MADLADDDKKVLMIGTGTPVHWWQPIHDALLAAGWVEVTPTDHGGAHPILNVPDIKLPARSKKKAPGWHDVHDRRGRRIK